MGDINELKNTVSTSKKAPIGERVLKPVRESTQVCKKQIKFSPWQKSMHLYVVEKEPRKKNLPQQDQKAVDTHTSREQLDVLTRSRNKTGRSIGNEVSRINRCSKLYGANLIVYKNTSNEVGAFHQCLPNKLCAKSERRRTWVARIKAHSSWSCASFSSSSNSHAFIAQERWKSYFVLRVSFDAETFLPTLRLCTGLTSRKTSAIPPGSSDAGNSGSQQSVLRRMVCGWFYGKRSLRVVKLRRTRRLDTPLFQRVCRSRSPTSHNGEEPTGSNRESV